MIFFYRSTITHIMALVLLILDNLTSVDLNSLPCGEDKRRYLLILNSYKLPVLISFCCINIFSRGQLKLFELVFTHKAFPLASQTRQIKSVSQPVNLPSALSLVKALNGQSGFIRMIIEPCSHTRTYIRLYILNESC